MKWTVSPHRIPFMLCDGPNPEPQPSAHQCQSWKGSLLFTDRNCSCIQVCNLVKGNGTQWSLVPGYHQLWFVIRKNESLWNRRCHLRVDRGWWVLSRKRWEPVKLGPVPTPVCFEATRKRLSLFLGIFVRLWQFHPWLCMCVCVWSYFSSNSKLAKLFRTVYPQRSTSLLKSDGKQQAKSEPRHFKTCPKTLCATPCNSPETLLCESTTKRRGWFHLPSHFEHHQLSHFASNLLQKSYRKLRGRIKNLNEKEFQCFKSRILKMTFVWNTPKNQKHVDDSRSWSAWALARTTEKTSSVLHQAGAWRLYPCDMLW